jgi:hypothetical protein
MSHLTIEAYVKYSAPGSSEFSYCPINIHFGCDGDRPVRIEQCDGMYDLCCDSEEDTQALIDIVGATYERMENAFAVGGFADLDNEVDMLSMTIVQSVPNS